MQILMVFLLVCFAWIFFRMHTLQSAVAFLAQILSGEGLFVFHFKFQMLTVFALILVTISVDAALIDRRRMVRLLRQRWLLPACLGLLLAAITFTGNFGAASFIYFQF